MIPAYLFVIGAVLGSFALNTARRVNQGRSVWSGRSICENCQAKIPWHDNVPIISYLLLRGKCRSCASPFGVGYLFVEMIGGCIFGLSWILSAEGSVLNIIWLISCSVLLYSSIYDFLYYELPDSVSIPFAGALFVTSLILQYKGIITYNTFIDGLVAALGLAIIFVLIIILSKGKMGGGEIRLGLIMGLILGTRGSYVAFMLGIFIATIYGGLLYIVNRRKRIEVANWLQTKVPLVPFFSLGIFVSHYYGSAIFRLLFGI